MAAAFFVFNLRQPLPEMQTCYAVPTIKRRKREKEAKRRAKDYIFGATCPSSAAQVSSDLSRLFAALAPKLCSAL